MIDCIWFLLLQHQQKTVIAISTKGAVHNENDCASQKRKRKTESQKSVAIVNVKFDNKSSFPYENKRS